MPLDSWTCVRQRAGDYVKERRYIRPWRKAPESPGERKRKNEIVSQIKTAFRRSPVERVELLVGLMGIDSTFYTLTFDDEHLPVDYTDARRIWSNFLHRLKKNKGRPVDYIFCTEKVHGFGRWHFHVIFRDSDINEFELLRVWKNGMIDARPSITMSREWTPRLRAEYMLKDRRTPDGIPLGKRPWGASNSLRAKLPPPEKSEVKSGNIRIPKGAVEMDNFKISNFYGKYNNVAYMVTRARARDIS